MGAGLERNLILTPEARALLTAVRSQPTGATGVAAGPRALWHCLCICINEGIRVQGYGKGHIPPAQYMTLSHANGSRLVTGFNISMGDVPR